MRISTWRACAGSPAPTMSAGLTRRTLPAGTRLVTFTHAPDDGFPVDARRSVWTAAGPLDAYLASRA